jgi:hypothetical protein
MSVYKRPLDWWNRYRSLISNEAGPVQVLETEKAFYAGMFAILRTFEQMQEDDVEEKTGGLLLGSFYDEVRLKAMELTGDKQERPW